MTKKVIIVGAGPGGLASAMLLGSAGLDVTVIEQNHEVGGRSSSLRKDGFRFDRGPTFFIYPQVLESIYKASGFDLNSEVELTRLNPSYRLRFESGGQIDAFADMEKLKQEVARLNPDDAANIDRYLADNKMKFDAFKPILEQPFLRHRDIFKLPLMDLLPLFRPWNSVNRDLKTFFKDPRIQLAFSFQTKYLGMSPFNCPSLFTILAYLEHAFGVFHPRGGCGEIAENMASIARRVGVRVRLNESVKHIEFEGRRATEVWTDKGHYPCDALVVNADFGYAMTRWVPDHLRKRWNNKRLEKAEFSCSTYMLYLGLKRKLPDLAHHTICLADDFDQHLIDNEERHCLPDNPCFYVHNPSLLDDSLAPKGQSALYVLVPVSHMHQNIDWAKEKEVFKHKVFAQMRRYGVEIDQADIVSETVFTPADWQNSMNIYRGATFNLTHKLQQMLSLRPGNRFQELEGVYLVGGGTHPGSGLPVIYQSSKISSQLLADDFGLGRLWPEVDDVTSVFDQQFKKTA